MRADCTQCIVVVIHSTVWNKPVSAKPVWNKPVSAKPVLAKPVSAKPVLDKTVLDNPGVTVCITSDLSDTVVFD